MVARYRLSVLEGNRRGIREEVRVIFRGVLSEIFFSALRKCRGRDGDYLASAESRKCRKFTILRKRGVFFCSYILVFSVVFSQIRGEPFRTFPDTCFPEHEKKNEAR